MPQFFAIILILAIDRHLDLRLLLLAREEVGELGGLTRTLQRRDMNIREENDNERAYEKALPDRPPPAAHADRCRRVRRGAGRLRRAPRPTPPTRSAGYRRAARSRCSTTIPIGSARSSAISAIIETTLEPGPSDATADGEARRPEPGRHGLSVAGRLLAGAGAGHSARLRLPHGRRRCVRLRLPQGRGASRHQGHRGQDHRARQRRLAVDRRSRC